MYLGKVEIGNADELYDTLDTRTVLLASILSSTDGRYREKASR